jgi:DNA-directed RNA polymerase subunit RPC12/RpoP
MIKKIVENNYFDEIKNKIVERIKDELENLEISCPDCEFFGGDDQYTCTTCWNEGGDEKINVLEYLKKHPEIINKVVGKQ